LFSACPSAAAEFDVIGFDLNFVVLRCGPALGPGVKYFDKLRRTHPLRELAMDKGGIMADRQGFSPNASITVTIEHLLASGDSGRAGRSRLSSA
jgi:hypothetical protein